MEIGKRIQTLRQMFNIKQGIDPTSWRLPARMAGNPPLTNGPLKGVTLQNDEMVRLHWHGFGWSAENGVPTWETISALGIDTLLDRSEE